MSVFKNEDNEQEYTGIIGEETEDGAVNSAEAGNSSNIQDVSGSDGVSNPENDAASDSIDEDLTAGDTPSSDSESGETNADESSAEAGEAGENSENGEHLVELPEEPQPKKKEPKMVPFWVVPVVAAIVLVACVGAFLGFRYVPQLVESYQNSRLIEEGRLYTALDVYNAAYQDNPTDKTAAKNAANAMFKLGYFTNAESALESAYTDEELESTGDEEIRLMVDYIDRINSTMDIANSMYTELSSSDESSDANALWEDARSQLEALYGNTEYCDEFVAYYQYVFASVFGQDIATQMEYVERACNFNSEISYMFYPTLAAMHRFDGNYDEAIRVCQVALEYNIEDFSSLVEMSYNYLLKGDFENGVKNAEEAYEIAPEESVAINGVLLAYAASGDTEKYDEVTAQASALGIEPSSEIQGYLDGTYTLEDILIGAE